jgi:hypothetical protein
MTHGSIAPKEEGALDCYAALIGTAGTPVRHGWQTRGNGRSASIAVLPGANSASPRRKSLQSQVLL